MTLHGESLDQHLQRLLLQGVRWQDHGRSLATGLDCYGLIVHAYAWWGIPLPTVPEQAERSFVPCVAPYQAGDIGVCRFPLGSLRPHLVLFCAPTWGWHCGQTSGGLARWRLHQLPWRRVLHQAWRLRESPCT